LEPVRVQKAKRTPSEPLGNLWETIPEENAVAISFVQFDVSTAADELPQLLNAAAIEINEEVK